jgi:hypothetical protein
MRERAASLRSDCGNKFADLAQTIPRHAAVYGFVITGFDDVSFVPDANIAPARSKPPVKFNPGRPMLFVLGAGIGLEMRKRAPILDDDATKTGSILIRGNPLNSGSSSDEEDRELNIGQIVYSSVHSCTIFI